MPVDLTKTRQWRFVLCQVGEGGAAILTACAVARLWRRDAEYQLARITLAEAGYLVTESFADTDADAAAAALAYWNGRRHIPRRA
ncbi:hypothetical protein OIE63_40520 (plasmid) [Streptomyces sp. NBC_01795]|uniref:hypothetical protein n=1 Tax=Streptomyces sp. NBC_01795 TaxID=2975943 RepID=UPI002DDC86FA|nr:hypothetical protein [Streptomyces sp. NBC_01795]WSA97774.1 hypothetical protein OIE63_40520 [Streptomyces sp. NBC_01795]